MLLFGAKNGNPISVSNYERLLRSFVDDNRDAPDQLDVEVDEYSTHIYRRTTATLVERAAGLPLASRLRGHANEQITRASYVVSAEEVAPITVEILDELLEEVNRERGASRLCSNVQEISMFRRRRN